MNEVTTAENQITVNKPQFNERQLQPGTALRISHKESNGYVNINANAIVEAIRPLQLEVIYMGKKDDRISNDLELKRTTIAVGGLGEKRGWIIEIIKGAN